MEIKSTEFFRNIKTLPPPGTEEFKQLISWEEEKIKGGVTVNGVYFSGWLYFHMNHWWIRKDAVDEWGNDIRISSLPDLRDNEWIRAEYLEQCKRDKKGYMEIGLRQGGKSEMEASYFGMNALMFPNTQNVIVCGNDNDLSLIKDKVDFGLRNVWEGINIPRLDKTWRLNQIRLGYKSSDGEDQVWSYIVIRNAKEGHNTEVAAGTTAKTFIMDEVGKYPFATTFKAAEPAIKGKFGWRTVPILVGCVCAGTKVWNNNGELINIENVKQENGILGYNGNTISKEKITYWQEPKETDCYRLTTNKGTTLECSYNHPILYRSRNETTSIKTIRTRNIYFKETKDLKIGDQIALIEEVPIYGKNKMWEPRFIGWLIGDGSYGKDKTPVLSNCDKEINNYITKNFNTVIERTYITKEGKEYRETRIKDICHILRDKYEIYGQTKDKKTLPSNIHSYQKDDICEFIGGLFDTDGSISYNIKTPPCIYLSAAYKNILLEVKLLLQKLGIHSSITFHKPNLKNPKDKNGYFRLNIIDRKSIQKFHEQIHFALEYKQEKLEKTIELIKNRKNKIPKETKGLRFERIVNVEYIGIKPVYNLTAGTTNTYIANGIVTHNTGGSFENGKDAENFFYNPEANNFLGITDDKTNKKTCMFLSGIYRMDDKIETTLDKYIEKEKGIILTEKDELSKIVIQVSDKEKALKNIQKERAAAKQNPDRNLYLKQLMYYPLTVDECFLTNSQSIFDAELAKKQKTKLQQLFFTGTPVVLHLDETNKVYHEFSDKLPISNYPVKPADNKDAPVVIYEFPIENPPYGLYVAGVDPYRQGQAVYSESLGSVYIYKRMHDVMGEKYQDMFVASYSARPDKKETWEEQARLLIKYYNARTLCENDDISFIEYMKAKGDAHYLEKQPEWLMEIVPNSTVKREYGLHRSAQKIIDYLHSCYKKYMEEIIYQEKNEEGVIISEALGITRIMDIMLLEETIQFTDDANVDRVVAAELAIAQAIKMDPIIGRVGGDSTGRSKNSYVRREKPPLFTGVNQMFNGRKQRLFAS